MNGRLLGKAPRGCFGCLPELFIEQFCRAAAQQRSFIRWMKAEEMKSVLAVRDIYTYGRVALEPGSAPPPGWMELMLVTHHQEPVGRCFQR